MATQTMKDKKTIIYCRVSTREQVDGYSLGSQEKVCISYAERNGINVVKIFREEGESAKTADRTKLIEALKYCQKHKEEIDYFLVYKLDRFSRSVYDSSILEFQLAKYGIEVKSATETFDSNTSSGKLNKHVLMAFAQFDNDMRAERTTEGMKRGVVDGGKWYWPEPIGYKRIRGDGIKGKIDIDPVSSKLVLKIFEEFSKGIYTQQDMIDLAKKIGLKSTKDKEISNQTMHKILRNGVYIGKFNCTYGEMDWPHLAIISKDTFWKCQDILERQRLKGKVKYKNKKIFPLQGFATCVYCGRPLTAQSGPNRHGKYYYYYLCYSRGCPGKKSINKEKLENTFIEYLKEITPKEEFLRLFKEVICDVWHQEYKKLNLNRSELEIKLQQLKDKKVNLIDMKGRGLIDDNDFTDSLCLIKQDITAVEINISKTQIEEFDVDEAVDYCFKFIKDIPMYWKQADFDTKLKIQAMIFPQKPIYDYEKFQTPVLSCIFSTKNTCHIDRCSLVGPRRIELRLPG